MRGLSNLTAALVASAAILAGCGGGGGSTPSAPTQNLTPAQTTTNKTAIGTAKLTLALPKVITATRNGKSVAVRAIPKGTKRTLPSGTARSPKFVDPSPNPGFGPCTGGSAGDNYLDIYVVSYGSATLLTDLDNQGEADDSLCVAQTADSTQTVSIPIYSASQNQIVAVEWDATGAYVLAVGETDFGSFFAGSTYSLSLTMDMNAAYVGITDLGFTDPSLVESYDSPYEGVGAACPGNSQVAFYDADQLGNFVPIGGYGGTTTPSVTSAGGGGSTAFAQTAVPGVYNIAWDSNCDDIGINASALNPAYPIYADAIYGEGNYLGIEYLYNDNYNNFDNVINQLDVNDGAYVTGTITIVNNDDL